MIEDHLTDAERRARASARIKDQFYQGQTVREQDMVCSNLTSQQRSNRAYAQDAITEAIRSCDSADACAAILGAVHGSTVFGPRDLDDLGNRISRFAWSQLDPKEAG